LSSVNDSSRYSATGLFGLKGDWSDYVPSLLNSSSISYLPLISLGRGLASCDFGKAIMFYCCFFFWGNVEEGTSLSLSYVGKHKRHPSERVYMFVSSLIGFEICACYNLTVNENHSFTLILRV